jgi:hypothetical protein
VFESFEQLRATHVTITHMGRIDVRLCAARNLADTQWISKPDPYCILRIENQKFKSTIKDNNLNPEWNEVFKFNVSDENSAQLLVEVWNKNVVSDELMGTYNLALNGLQKGVVRDEWFLLQRSRSNAEIRLRLLAHDFGSASLSSSVNAVAQPAPSAYPAPYQQVGGAQPNTQIAPPVPVQQPASYSQQHPSMVPPQVQHYPQQAGYSPYAPQQQPSQVFQPVNPMPAYGPPQPQYATAYPPQQNSCAPQGLYPAQQPTYGAPFQQAGYGAPPQQPYQAVPVTGVPLGYTNSGVFGGPAAGGYAPAAPFGAPPPVQQGYQGYPPPNPVMGYPQPQQPPRW